MLKKYLSLFSLLITLSLFTNCDERWWTSPSQSARGTLIFEDNFEGYNDGEYPDSNGWYSLWSGTGEDESYVVEGIYHAGEKSFNLNGAGSWTRSDGIDIDLADVKVLTYEVAVMVPEGSPTAAKMGFFNRLSGATSTEYNCVVMNPDSFEFTVKGSSGASTGIAWEKDTWYTVRVTLDYEAGLMNVWIDDSKVVDDLAAESKDTSSIFFISTLNFGSMETGVLYFDDVSVWTK